MSGVARDPPIILIVEDERELADLFSAWFDDRYTVRTAYGGREALELLDHDVSVALIDRRMPDFSGDELLDRIREQGYPCQVALVSAVSPGPDLLDLGFDDYLKKPVERQELCDTVDRLLERATYEKEIQEWLSLLSKKATLESEMAPAELENSERFSQLMDDIEEFQQRATRTRDELQSEELEALFRRFDGGDEPST